MDLRKLKTLIELVESSGISELEVTEGEEKVRIVKSGQAPAAAMPAQFMQIPAQFAPQFQPQFSTQFGAQFAPAAALPSAAAPEAAATPPAPSGHPLKSPMVGTFYGSAAAGSKAFVEVGSEVKEGDVLCIIEAMKLMNEIPSDRAGVVRQILVENGQPVEYGQVLFVIE